MAVVERKSKAGDVTNDAQMQKVASGVLKTFFSKGKTEGITEKEKSLSVQRIENIPVTYLILEASVEQRIIREDRQPSSWTPAVAMRKRYAREYNKWDVKCPNHTADFMKEANEVVLDDSTYLEDCHNCNANGYVPCVTCNQGYERCPSCFGDGTLNCGRCRGSGKVDCSYCNGVGSVIKYEQCYDEHNIPYQRSYRETCQFCFGSGTETCGNCGGNGWVTCGNCRGDGKIICRTCNGTQRVTCGGCKGGGHFLNRVIVDQSFDNIAEFRILEDYTIDPTLFTNQRFTSFVPNTNDFVLCEETSAEEIRNMKSYDIGALADKISAAVDNADNKRFIRYRARICERDVLLITYQISNAIYHALVDTQTMQVLMDRNPYESMAGDLMQQIKQHVKEGKFKTFAAECEDYKLITADENNAHSAEDLKKTEQKAVLTFMAISIAAAALLSLILTRRLGGISMFLSLLLSAGSVGYATMKYWKKAVVDNMYATYGIFAAVGLFAGLFFGKLITQIMNLF